MGIKKEEVSDDILMKEIDAFIADEEREDLLLEDHLKRLLELHDKAMMLHHPVAKVKRLKLLKQEITKVRRKLSMDKAGTSPGFKPKDTPTGLKSKASKRGGGREVSPEIEPLSVGGGRRLRAGKELETMMDAHPKSGGKAAAAAANKEGDAAIGKRSRSLSSENEELEYDFDVNKSLQPAVKKSKGDAAVTTQQLIGESSPSSSKSNQSPVKLTGGVNRRNAVLFNKKQKKQATSAPSNELAEDASAGKEEEQPVLSKRASTKVLSSTDDNLELLETEVRSPKPASTQESTAAAVADTAAATMASSGDESPVKRSSSSSSAKKKMAPPRSPLKLTGASPTAKKSKELSADGGGAASFQTYRRGGEMPGETDEETPSESATDALVSSEDDEDNANDSDSDSTNGLSSSTSDRMPLEPLDLVWAKCRGYPWYPALIINPKMPRTGYLHNGVPIPVPPQDVLDLTSTHTIPHFLILFFDAKRTWRWLQRDKLEPLGVHSELDKAKLVQSKKPGERKAVKKAYEDAILHRCRVTGENASISEESESEAAEESQE